MTPAEDQTLSALLGSSPFVAAVGANANGTTKLFPGEIPDDSELPAGVYERTDSQSEYVLDGTLAASRVSIAVMIWAKTRKEADDIALIATSAMSAAGHALTSSSNDEVPELGEYAAVRVFDVWEV